MASNSRLILQVVAAAVLWTAAPAIAADSAVIVSHDIAVKPAPVKHRTRIVVSRVDRELAAIPADLSCSGIWCGRQFVLMVGIGY
jgi:hypothetical protein